MCCPHEATHEYLIEHQAMQLLDTTDEWELQFYLLMESDKPIASPWPKKVALEKMGSPEHFWPVRRTRQKKTVAGVHMGWDLLPLPAEGEEQNPDQEDVESEDGIGIPAEGMVASPMDEIEIDETDLLVLEAEALEFLDKHPRKRQREDDEPALVAAATLSAEPAATPTAMAEQPELGNMALADEPGPEASNEASTEAAPVPPKAASPALPRVIGAREAGLDAVWFGSGKLTFYPKTNSIEVVCCNLAHNVGKTSCKMTRTCQGRHGKAGLLGGRPCGFLCAWLDWGEQVPDKSSHWAKLLWSSELSLPKRRDARAKLLSFPAGVQLASHERPQAQGEAEEPDTLDGYLR